MLAASYQEDKIKAASPFIRMKSMIINDAEMKM